jgi:thioredoxin-related protein
MKIKNIPAPARLSAVIGLYLLISWSVQAQDVIITIKLRGVFESKISLLALSGEGIFNTISVVDNIKSEERAIIKVPAEYLPGEFVLRFDYKENQKSTPYPSEKRIIINNQDLDLWIQPVYSNNPDSTWFQRDEQENSVYLKFMQENNQQMQQLGLLQNFLLNYDDNKSAFYQEGIKEYEKSRKSFNKWIKDQTAQNNTIFASNLFVFHYIPLINWRGSEAERKKSLRDNYFEGMEFNNPLIIKTTGLKEWMDNYVNLYGELATSITLRDSLFTIAGKTAIEKARTGNPQIYGWMVDYFFKGYESFNIESGIKMLQPYLDDPHCLTSKRKEIIKRLKGIETLMPGTQAPNMMLNDNDNNPFELYSFKTEKKYILLLFWSAECSHCRETVDNLYMWYLQEEMKQKVDIVAISVDETALEIKSWQDKIKELPEWSHLNVPEGIRSKVANDFYILSVPVMILVDSKTHEIISMPENVDQLVTMPLHK